MQDWAFHPDFWLEEIARTPLKSVGSHQFTGRDVLSSKLVLDVALSLPE